MSIGDKIKKEITGIEHRTDITDEQKVSRISHCASNFDTEDNFWWLTSRELWVLPFLPPTTVLVILGCKSLVKWVGAGFVESRSDS